MSTNTKSDRPTESLAQKQARVAAKLRDHLVENLDDLPPGEAARTLRFLTVGNRGRPGYRGRGR